MHTYMCDLNNLALTPCLRFSHLRFTPNDSITHRIGNYAHPVQFMHTLFRLIRVHVGVQIFFQHLHRFLDAKLREVGAPDSLHTCAVSMLTLADLGSVPMGSRWESMEKKAVKLRSKPELISTEDTLLRFHLARAGIRDLSLLPMLELGLVAVGVYEHHSWFSQPSVDSDTYAFNSNKRRIHSHQYISHFS